MNIVLIGMRGSGKTTTGKMLAKKLNKQFIDIDEFIGKEIGGKISIFVTKFGWKSFRDIEIRIVEKVAKFENSVISCGGGVVENPINILNLKRNGFITYLSVSIDTLYNRIGEDKDRPLLSNANSMKTDLENMLKKRKDLYEKAADLIITVNNKTVDEICSKIINILKNKHD